jgi:hypothetical protein
MGLNLNCYDYLLATSPTRDSIIGLTLEEGCNLIDHLQECLGISAVTFHHYGRGARRRWYWRQGGGGAPKPKRRCSASS